MYQLREENKEFWQEQLANIEPIDLSFLKLGEAGAKEVSSTQVLSVPEMNEIRFSFDKEILLKLDKLKNRYQITPYLYSESICAMVLHRYTSQDRFDIGYPVTIGQRKDFICEAQINLSIIPYDFTKINNFLDIVNQTTQWFNSLEQLEILTTTNKEVSNLLFTQIDLKDRTLINSGTRVGLLSSLTFEQEVKDEKINYTVRYRADKINAYLLKEFVDCYQRLFIEVLNELINVGDISKLNHIKDYSLLSSEQYEQIVYQRNQTRKEYPRDKAIYQLFEEQVERAPDSIALMFGKERLSYKELNYQANRLAHYLRENGVKEGTLVGVNLDRNLKLVVVLLAILKTGGAYLPLDPNYPEDRLRFMISDSEIPILITQDSFIKLPWLQNSIYSIKQKGANKVSAFSIESIEALVKDYSSDNLTNITTPPGGLAYVVYTSGSTGQPKGVCGTHTGIVNRLIWGFEAFPYEEREVCCQKTSLNFVDHIAELFSPLVSGIPIVLLSDQAVKGLNINAMLEEIETYSVTRIVLVPSLLQGILSVIQEAGLQRLRSLKYIFCSGENLPNSLAQKCYKLLPWVKLINIYGSSEVSADAMYYEVITAENVNSVFESYFHEGLDKLKSELQIAADNLITTPLVGLEALKENFKNFQLPSSPTEYQEYYNLLQQKVFPYIINTGSPQFIGHMTSVLPAFIYELGKLVSMLNQNVVKIETSKALTLLEREIIAVVHNRFFNKDKGFYELHIQDPMSNLGSVASNGTISNITALWAARNNSFPPDGTFKGVAEEGINAALKYYKYEDSIILVSPFLHYSFEKAASLLGVGKKSIHYLPITQSGVVDILALEKCINSYRAQRKHILAIIGIAGATETGFIDPLLEIGEIAKNFMIHYHVDAAFGGSLIFSDKHKHLLKGIEYADTITVCGHKQLYVPMGLSLCIFSDPKIAHAIYNTADYQSIINSFDFGKVTLEGSRPSASLLLHAVLNIFGKTGFEHLITLGIRNARYFRDRILQSNNFELVVEPHINIVNYRYIPKQFRKKIQLMKLSSEDNKLIDEANILLQTTQFNQGKTFISKTTIPCSKYSEEIVTLRAVFSNPLTTPDDINQVLNDQLKIATTAIEHEEIEEQIDTLSVNSNELNISVPIGRPIINTTLYVLDRDLKPLPLGVIGELYVGGVGLARGYLNKPELTAERFIGNPFQTKEEKVDESYGPNGRNARLYKTGDLVRWLPDGNIEYIERSDFQVKIRGYRVELGEIENSLSNFEGVKQAVVLAREHHRAKYLVGYYVADSKLDEAEILRYLQSKLPEYMVPSTLVHLEKLLLTINGKLDRKALPEPEFTSSADYMGPRNEIERQVCRIWAEVLRFPENKLGIQDDFFRLGGNSILAMKLVSKINKALKANIDIAGVFEARTISRLINNYIVTKKDNYLIGEEYEF